MAWIDPRFEAHQRKRWTRPDSYRFFKPGCPEAKMPGWLDPWATRVRMQEAAEEEARAAFEAEVQALRASHERVREMLAEVKYELAWRRFVRKYSPDQPRVPKGNPDGGQWTGDAGKDGGDRARSTDISAQRRGGPRMPATPAQHARLAVANARAREAVSRVQQIDPHWRPQSVTSTDNAADYEVMIRAKQAETREAEARFMALSLARRDGPYTSPESRTFQEILAPRAGEDIRIVSPAEFETIRTNLMVGARQIEADAGYNGVWYKRQDGSIFGLRLSAESGLTLDVIRAIIRSCRAIFGYISDDQRTATYFLGNADERMDQSENPQSALRRATVWHVGDCR